MAKPRVILSDSQRRSVYEMHLAGESTRDIMAAFDISEPTVYRILKKEQENVAAQELVIAGNKKDGRLISIGRGKYDGTCLVGTRAKSREFKAPNAIAAKAEWERWCAELRESEAAFLKNCEPREVAEVPVDEPPVEAFVSEPAPVPEVDVRPWKDVAEERQQHIDELNERIEYLEGIIEGFESQTVSHDGPAYLLWLKGDEPKAYGLYTKMDAALAEADRIDEVAAFLGNSGAFEVEEVEWRGQ